MLTISPLARHRELLPLIASWFLEEWPEWYGPEGHDPTADVEAFARSERTLPVGLLAFAGNDPVGVAVLKAESLPTHRHLTPWAAAGLVVPAYRRRGIGQQLLAALTQLARELHYDRIYCGTATAVT